MSNCTLIIGEAGTGKTSSLRNLNPKETFVLSVLDKPFPFRGARTNYTKASKGNPDGNYAATDNYSKLSSWISFVDQKRPDINVLILDDFQYIMANEFMRRATENDFKKFSEIGQHAWSLIDQMTKTRDDLYCFVLSHSHVDEYGHSRCKTIGKLLNEKITLEGMFTTTFHSLVIDGEYKFLTQHDGIHVARSPMGMFADRLIDNDLDSILSVMRAYE